ncbi:MAG: AEC family transporter [Pseudomonadota bacterium]
MMSPVVGSALFPVILLIVLAFTIRRVGLVNDTHVAGVERVTYVVFFPALLFSNLSTASFDDLSVWSLVAVLAGLQIVLGGLSWLLLVKFLPDGPSATSAFQGANRFNSYIIFALVFAVYGDAGIQIAAVPLALMIIIVNVYCVTMLARHGTPPEGATSPNLWRSLITNPLIVACVLGLAVNPLQIDWPGPVDTMFGWFGTAAIALGLFAVGAGLSPTTGKGSVLAIGLASAIKLIVKPAIFLAIALMIGLSPDLIAIGLMCTIVPPATSAYILARQLGGNAPLMAQIVTVATILSAATVTAWFLIWPVGA